VELERTPAFDGRRPEAGGGQTLTKWPNDSKVTWGNRKIHNNKGGERKIYFCDKKKGIKRLMGPTHQPNPQNGKNRTGHKRWKHSLVQKEKGEKGPEKVQGPKKKETKGKGRDRQTATFALARKGVNCWKKRGFGAQACDEPGRYPSENGAKNSRESVGGKSQCSLKRTR